VRDGAATVSNGAATVTSATTLHASLWPATRRASGGEARVGGPARQRRGARAGAIGDGASKRALVALAAAAPTDVRHEAGAAGGGRNLHGMSHVGGTAALMPAVCGG